MPDDLNRQSPPSSGPGSGIPPGSHHYPALEPQRYEQQLPPYVVSVQPTTQPLPGTPSWWAVWAGKTPLDRLLILGLVLLVGFFVYDQSEQKRHEREDRNKSLETEIRIRQEEQERNRQSAADRDKTQREWSQFENDRTRRSIDENTKAVLTFNGNAVRLEAAVNALVRRLPNPVDDPDGCELRPWWDRMLDGAISDPDGRARLSRLHGADDDDGRGVVRESARPQHEHNLRLSSVADGAEVNFARREVVPVCGQVDADAMPGVVRRAS